MPTTEGTLSSFPDLVAVPCGRCNDEVFVPRDTLRTHIDNNTRPVHMKCPARTDTNPHRTRRITAASVILLAAYDLTKSGHTEFSEWELTVAAWSLDRMRFGMRGFEKDYPDHKRVSMEMVATKVTSPINQRYIERVRPNTYRITTAGRIAASDLREQETQHDQQ